MIGFATARLGGLDVLVANAGVAGRVTTFRASATETVERVLDFNPLDVGRAGDAALPKIIRQRRASPGRVR